MNFFITNGIQCFYYHCFWLNTDFSNSFFVSPPTSPQWIVADERFRQHRNRTQCVSIETFGITHYSDFTSSYEPFSQALKSFDYVLSGSKRKITWRRKMQTKQQLKWCTRNVHPSFADFRPGLGVNFHILLTQNWLWESSLSLLSLLDKVRFVQRKLKPEEAFMTKKWMVLAEHLLAQVHITSNTPFHAIYYNQPYPPTSPALQDVDSLWPASLCTICNCLCLMFSSLLYHLSQEYPQFRIPWSRQWIWSVMNLKLLNQ